ncbi:hypothetical protein [Mesorhizobium sp. M2E.F.Ca.ET.219.01.1.1]|uniref:hypothetical protein n=1 Tax=Mesorhizobium sp. M2E.F.Ca.ET.219.01.1.1 TaxID=2500530 RepID=UPI000FDBEFFD|nr:hypothetical protein [Mesorhizobium sp. M2E.F.Ca.ET.219.01.1.1]TGQ06640.1 hypothetical protein EN862_026620 [Mesorhizobium sp. M2E.F.Ca.ET.219.01.1.1]
MTGKKAQTGQKPKTAQIEKFRELAREIETVDSEEPLNAAIGSWQSRRRRRRIPKRAAKTQAERL